MYIDVPFDYDKHYTESEFENMITSKVEESGVYVSDVETAKEPLTEVHDYYGEDHEDIINFKNPVGFIAPDGLFYGCNSSDFSLAHLALAKEVWSYYTKDSQNILKKYDKCIEHHKIDVYPLPKEEKPIYWTDAQRETMMRYMKKVENEGDLILFDGPFLHKRIRSSEFAQMDKFAIVKCFGYGIL